MTNKREKEQNLIEKQDTKNNYSQSSYSFDIYNSENEQGFAVSETREKKHGSAFSYPQKFKLSLDKLFHKRTKQEVNNEVKDTFKELMDYHGDNADLYDFEKNGELNLFGLVNDKNRKDQERREFKNLYYLRKPDKEKRNTEKNGVIDLNSASSSGSNSKVKAEMQTNIEEIFKEQFRYEAEDAYAVSYQSYKKHLTFVLALLAFLFIVLLIFLYIFSKPYNFYEKITDPYSIYRQQQELIFKEKNLQDAKNEMNTIKEALAAIDRNKGQGNGSGDEKGLFVDDTKVNLDFDRSKISSESIYLYNLTDDVPVFMWKAQLSLDLSAITQVFTTDIFMTYLKNPYKEVQVPSEIVFYLYEQNARQSGFAPGEKCAMIDLAYASILAGATDCAMAEAYYVAGNQSDFVDIMNEYAKELKLKNTNFVNSSGLPADKHYSSAEDIGIFFRHLYNSPRMMKILKTGTYVSKKTDFRPDGLSIDNVVLDYFKKNPINHVNVLAGRTGANPQSGRNLVTISEKNGKEYLLVTLSAKKYGSNSEATDHYEDHTMILGDFLK